MKLYCIKSVNADGLSFSELTTGQDKASKRRTALKKAEFTDIIIDEVEVDPTRAGIIEFYNARHGAHLG